MSDQDKLLSDAYSSIEELLWTLEDAGLLEDVDDCDFSENLCPGACTNSGCLAAKKARALAAMKSLDLVGSPRLTP